MKTPLSPRAIKARNERLELQAYRQVTADALSMVNPTPQDLKESLEWRGKCADLVSDLIVTHSSVRELAKARGILDRHEKVCGVAEIAAKGGDQK